MAGGPGLHPRERAALGWAESVTLVSQTHVPDDVYAEARTHLEEAELVNLTLAVVAINGWNRLAIGFRVPPSLGKAGGGYTYCDKGVYSFELVCSLFGRRFRSG